jgi:hypothetical protein
MENKITHTKMPAMRDQKFNGTPSPVKRGRGRPLGSRNKMGRDLMELVMQAAENVGYIERDANNHWVALCNKPIVFVELKPANPAIEFSLADAGLRSLRGTAGIRLGADVSKIFASAVYERYSERITNNSLLRQKVNSNHNIHGLLQCRKASLA